MCKKEKSKNNKTSSYGKMQGRKNAFVFERRFKLVGETNDTLSGYSRIPASDKMDIKLHYLPAVAIRNAVQHKPVSQ
mgnify:CR=1 FL=1